MIDYKELKKILNSGLNVKHYANGKTGVTDSVNFRGMSLSVLDEAQSFVEEGIKNETFEFARKCNRQIDTVDSCTKRALDLNSRVIDSIKYGNLNARSELDRSRMFHSDIRDSIVNSSFNLGNKGVDPLINSIALPNIYISPWEASSLYSQKGIFEIVINKKAKSVLLNGGTVINKHLTQKQIDLVKEKMEFLNVKQIISDSMRDSFVYGGNLTFPMFKKDTPLTTNLPLSTLLKLGVVGKDCIDYFVQLDRWNTFIIPPYNPTQKDFLRPEVYTIPFLGGDVHHSRCSRVVTARQAGYIGQVTNMGWGISDFCGYLQSGMNYKVTMQSIPLMVQQMSILARQVNVDGVLATEGSNALDSLVTENTIRMREVSADNPIALDVLGNITAINRNFSQVPELIRLERQDFAADAGLPEPMLFSSNKGDFARGDDTDGNLNKQWETVKTIYKDVESQIKNLIKIVVIDALGATPEVMEALPYTKFHFDEPIIASTLERAQIGKTFSENVFNLVSAKLPMDLAVEMASKHVSEDFAPSAELIDKLKEIQAKSDLESEERFTNEMALQNVQIEQGAQITQKTENGFKEKPKVDEKEKKYTRLEQKQHETTKGANKREEGLAKAEAKKL